MRHGGLQGALFVHKVESSFRTGFQALDNAGWLRDISIHLRVNLEQIGPLSAKLTAAAELLKTEGLNVRFTAANLSDPSSAPRGPDAIVELSA